MKRAKATNTRPNSATGDKFILRLYVAGRSPNSVRALKNLDDIRARYLAGVACEVEIVDVLVTPLRALADRVVVTPCLIKLSPLPGAIIVGHLGHTEAVLIGLGIEGAIP